MTKSKTPDFSDYLKMFDPANVSKMFDPKNLMEQFTEATSNFDPMDTINKAQGSFEAMTKANEEAAAAYKDLLEKQMKIFHEVTAEAAEQMKASSSKDANKVYQESVERALQIMTELSEASREANERAYNAVKGKVDEVLADIRKG